MKVKIWSDVMCPFCYIGKKNFEMALEKLPFREEIEIEWKSFQLDPTISSEDSPQTVNEYLAQRKNMPLEQIEMMQNRVKEMGSKVGIDFKQENSLIANTFLAHQLIQYAKTKGKANALEELLFLSYFTHGENIGDPNVLQQIGEKLGLPSEEIANALNTDLYKYEVSQDIAEAKNIGVTGVPFFVFEDKYAVSGAQPVELFIDALSQTYNETLQTKSSNPNDSSCSIEGCD